MEVKKRIIHYIIFYKKIYLPLTINMNANRALKIKTQTSDMWFIHQQLQLLVEEGSFFSIFVLCLYFYIQLTVSISVCCYLFNT